MRKLSKRKVIALAAALLAWIGLITVTSYAALQDVALLTGNNLTVGSANLLISNSQNASSTIYEETREGFAVQLVPGQVAERFFLLKNSSAGEVAFRIGVGAVLTTENLPLAQAVTLEFAPVDAAGELIDGANWRSGTLKDLASGPLLLDGAIAKGQAQRYKVKTTLNANYQLGDQSLGYDLTFTGNQQIN